jgi:hypothetical protein
MRKKHIILMFTALLIAILSLPFSMIWAATKIHTDLNMQDNSITDLADPVDDQDAATKKYVDDNVTGDTTFIGLEDTPAAFSGNAEYFLQVNSDGTAIQFYQLPYTLYMLNTVYDTNSDSIIDIAASVSDESITESSLDIDNSPSNDVYLRYNDGGMEWAIFPGMLALTYDINLDSIVDMAADIEDSTITESKLVVQQGPYIKRFLGWNPLYETMDWVDVTADETTLTFDGYEFSVKIDGITEDYISDDAVNETHLDTSNSPTENYTLRWVQSTGMFWSNLEDTFYTETETDTLLSEKIGIVSGAIENNFANFDSEGNIQDSGFNETDLHTQNTDTGTTSSSFNIGSDDNTLSETIFIPFGNQSSKPGFRWNPYASAIEYSNDGITYTEITSASSSSTFLDSTDTPETYISQAGKILVVNTGETALEFQDASSTHNHDDSYYTETELSINGILDNRYYTETELSTVSSSSASGNINCETMLVDGYVKRSTSETWANKRSSAGTDVGYNQANERIVRFTRETTESLAMARGIFVFDTSGLDDDITIESAIFYIYITSKIDIPNPMTGDNSIGITSMSTASETTLYASDYNIASWSDDLLCETTILYADIVTSAYNGFTFNETGIAHINLGGSTTIGTRFGCDIFNTTPSSNTNTGNRVEADYAAGSNPPYLRIAYTSASTVSANSQVHWVNITNKPIFYLSDLTTTNTTITAFEDANNNLILSANSSRSFTIMISSMDENGDAAAYKFHGLIKRDNSGNTSIIGSVDKTVLAEDQASMDCDIVANDTTESLEIQATGLAATSVKWNATIQITETLYE